MVKCADCFKEKLIEVVGSRVFEAESTAIAVALAQSFDAVIIHNGKSLCEQHAAQRLGSDQ